MSRLPYGNTPMPHESYVTKGSLTMPELPSKWLWKLIEAEVRFGEQLLVHETSDEVVNFGTHWSYVYAHRGCRVNSIGSSRGDLHGLKNVTFIQNRIEDYTFPGHSLDLLACDVLMSPLESVLPSLRHLHSQTLREAVVWTMNSNANYHSHHLLYYHHSIIRSAK